MNFTRQGPHGCLKLGAPGSPGRVANTHNSPAKQSIRVGPGASLNNVLYFPNSPAHVPQRSDVGLECLGRHSRTDKRAGRYGIAGGGSGCCRQRLRLSSSSCLMAQVDTRWQRAALTTELIAQMRCFVVTLLFPHPKYPPPFSFSYPPFLFRASFFSGSFFSPLFLFLAWNIFLWHH